MKLRKLALAIALPFIASSAALAQVDTVEGIYGEPVTSIYQDGATIVLDAQTSASVANLNLDPPMDHFTYIGSDNNVGTTFTNISKSCRVVYWTHTTSDGYYKLYNKQVNSLARVNYNPENFSSSTNRKQLVGSKACNTSQDQTPLAKFGDHFTNLGGGQFLNNSNECRKAHFSILDRNGTYQIRTLEVQPLGNVSTPSYSSSAGYRTSFLGSWACDGPVPSKTVTGDFNGDGRTDTANYYDANGQWWVTLAGSAPTMWTQFGTHAGWTAQLVGDFNGDGKDDIANFHPSNGTWWVSTSSGSRFSNAKWADFYTNSGWQNQRVVDDNGDGKDDISNYHPSNNSTWVSVSNGSSFSTYRKN